VPLASGELLAKNQGRYELTVVASPVWLLKPVQELNTVILSLPMQ
jgi:hypothetical protein